MDAVTLALIKYLSGNGGGSGLPAVTSADNGSELIVKNGAWAKQQKKFIVTLTPTSPDFSGTMDKTVAEINAAYEAGQEIWFNIASGALSITVPLKGVTVEQGFSYPSFDGFVIDNIHFAIIAFGTYTTNDGTEQTYSTTIYTLTPAS